jgi:hypothetical protein
MNNHSNEVLQNLQKYVCSKKDDLCFNLCFDDSGMCKECKNKYEKHDITNTDDFENVKSIIVTKIRALFVEMDNSIFNKVGHAFIMYRILMCNPVFIISYGKFCFTLINKICEFFSDDITFMRIDRYYNDNKNDIYIEYVYNYIKQIYNLFKNNISDYNTNHDNIIPIYINFIEEFYKSIKNLNIQTKLNLKESSIKKVNCNDIVIIIPSISLIDDNIISI